ncbi:MAG TPA: Rossmann-like and DUF2520 domain-containing protein [Terriglobales bacterium]|nr:Rossmann-like and DUF2520 domain-containing protein [Terriglobales bacterium]
MAGKPSVAIIGAGSLGGTLALALHTAGFPVEELVYRSDERRVTTIARRCKSSAVTLREAQLAARLVWICVGDASIRPIAAAMAKRGGWEGKTVFHSSGALSSDQLVSLKRRGASVASVHPMMSFVRAAQSSFEGVSFALEGDAAAIKQAATIAHALGGVSFKLKKKDKALYHALGAFSSPLFIAQMAAAESIGRKLGLRPAETRRVIGPILQKTLQNYLQHGPAAAFSGPIVRGDVETVKRNLAALSRVRGAREIYTALAKLATEILPVKNRKNIQQVLK